MNNLEWTRGLETIDFLRNVGKHFSVNAMIQRDFVRSRLEREGSGISYTEFSYVLLQAYDFLELARRYDCAVQLGGSDQWGNIVAGIDLVRRVLRRPAYALSVPLFTKRDGSKFGKSAAGAVWLDPERTSPYAFYQFWLNCADADAVHFLHCFTLLQEQEIEAAANALEANPERRDAQRLLAREVTRLVTATRVSRPRNESPPPCSATVKFAAWDVTTWRNWNAMACNARGSRRARGCWPR